MANLTVTEYDERTFYGTWRVYKFEAFVEGASAKNSESEIMGTEFTLEESSDVRWKIPENVEAIPLFSCESYEVILTHPGQLTFISTSVGRIGPFSAEFDAVTQLRLTFDKSFALCCEKVPQSEQIQEAPFSFLPALERGYFSDLVITSSTGKNYHTHRIILKLCCPEQSWDFETSVKKQSARSYQACVLDGLSDIVLSTVLHYMYSESLPSGLSENAARECAIVVEKISGFERLAKLCRNYLENYAVRTKIEHLCRDLETCGWNIVEQFKFKPEGSRIMSESEAMWQGCKLAVKEFAVACLKAVQICKLFADHRNELSREERHRIMKHCRNTLPNLLVIVAEFCHIMSSHLSKQSEEARSELASYFLVEAEPLFDEANSIVSEIRKTLETIINSDVSTKRRQKESILAKTLKNAVHIKELAKLRRLHLQMVDFMDRLLSKRELFVRLPDHDKIAAVCHIMECAADEISVALNRIQHCQDNFDDRINWTQWKYFFKMIAAKVSWVVEKCKCNRTSISKALGTVRKLMKRDDFDAALRSIGLIDDSNEVLHSEAATSKSLQSQDVESLCISPGPRDSTMSARSDKMLSEIEAESNFADMKFVVHYNDTDGESLTETISAHRVIIACRCDWFRRALLSGMKEDIKREINIYDCHPDLFRQFLRYLYTGKLDCSSMTVDALADLIALSDQYEVDSLKSVCEGALEPQISNDNVLELLVIGERFNASSLRECCMHHALNHAELLESEIFNELPPNLQVEVRDLTEFHQRSLMKKTASISSSGRLRFRNSSPTRTLTDTNADLSSEMEMIDQLTHALHERHLQDENSESEIDEQNISEECEACCVQLRDILGPEVTAEELQRIALAADFDINRALNHYFASQESPWV